VVAGNRSLDEGGKPKQKICEGCGRPFSCSAEGTGCWCKNVELSSCILFELRARFTDCLCLSCLLRESWTELANPTFS
jgi:hypothetical protein